MIRNESYLVHSIKQACGWVRISERAFSTLTSLQAAITEDLRRYPNDEHLHELRGSPSLVGVRVRYEKPSDPDEAAERFRILEVRGDRAVLMPEATMNWAITPTCVRLLSDLTEAND